MKEHEPDSSAYADPVDYYLDVSSYHVREANRAARRVWWLLTLILVSLVMIIGVAVMTNIDTVKMIEKEEREQLMADSHPISATEWQQIQDLTKCIGDLDGFEKDFAQSMERKRKTDYLTEKQSVKLEELWNKHCGH